MFDLTGKVCFVTGSAQGIGKVSAQKLAELGAKEEDIPQLVETLCRGDGRDGTISGFVTLDEADCTKIYQMML